MELERRKILELIKQGKLSAQKAYKLQNILAEQQVHKEKPLQIDTVPTDIAVIGMSCKFAGADNPDQFWDNLKQGINSITEIPSDRWDINLIYDSKGQKPYTSVSKWGGFIKNIYNFDCSFFNISPREAEVMDPQQRLFLEEAYKALDQAGYAKVSKDGLNCSVYVGYGDGDYKFILSENNVPPDAYYFMGNSGSILAARISYHLNLKGPSIPVDTACSSSLVAVNLACRSIVSGESEMALAGGVTLFTTPNIYYLTSKSGMLSTDGQCKTFDKAANGFVPGEGVGVLVLKRLDKALEDRDNIHAVIKGYCLNQDGKTNGITAPNSISQTALEKKVYKEFKINPSTIIMVEAHGTGTRLGDPIEVDALTDAFSEFTDEKQFCAIGSVKSNIGHTQLAAGAAGTIKAALCLKNRTLVPTLNFKDPNEHIDFINSPFYVGTTLLKLNGTQKNRATVSAFGFSGTNAHIVLEEPPVSGAFKQVGNYWPLCISAKSEKALQQKIQDLHEWMLNKKQQEISLANISYTLLVKRDEFKYRKTWIANTPDTFLKELENELGKSSPANSEPVELKNADNAQLEVYRTVVKNISYDKAMATQLAQFYETGVQLYWSDVFEKHQLHTVELPVYPLAGRAYKVQSIPGMKEQYKHVFTVEESQFFVKDHLINKVSVLPGVMYIEYLLQAAGKFGITSCNTIENLLWLQPLVIYSTNVALHLELVKNKAKWNFRFYTKKGESETQYVTGTLTEDNKGKKSLLIAELNSKCTLSKSSQTHYEEFRQRGMHHGETMRAVEEILKGDAEAFVLLKQLQPQSATNEFLLHPAILDSSLQSITAIVDSDGSAGNLFLPYGLKKITVNNTLETACYAYVRENSKNTQGQIRYFDISILDLAGNVLVEVEGLTMRPVSTDKQQSQEIKTLVFNQQLKLSNYTVDNKIYPRSLIFLGEEDGNAKLFKHHVNDTICLKYENWNNTEQIMHSLENVLSNHTTLNIVYPLELQQADYLEFVNTILNWSKIVQKNDNLQMNFICCCQANAETLLPEIAAIDGLGKTLKLECKRINIKLVASEKELNTPELVLAEFNRHDSHLVYLSPKGRQIPVLTEQSTILGSNAKSVFENNKRYLITGGTGKLGLHIAKYVTSNVASTVIIIGRKITTEQINDLQQWNLEQKGKIVFQRADITDKVQTENVLHIIDQEYGAINGVIHAAGITKDAYFWNKSIDDIKTVIAPKIIGTQLLDELTAHMKLDFFVLYGSVTAITGNHGQADYVYANSYLNHWAETRAEMVVKGKRFGKTISINWPLWEDGGMQIDSNKEKMLQNNAGIYRLATNKGLSLLEQCIASPHTQLIIYNGVESKIKKLLNNQIDYSLEQPNDMKTNNIQTDLSVKQVRNKLLSKLIAYIKEVMKVADEDIRLQKEMSEYGFDSISFTELVNRINEAFGTDFMPLIFFEYPTLQKLSDFMLAEHKDELINVLMENVETEEQDKSVAVPPLSETNAYAYEKTPRIEMQENNSDDIAIVGVSGVFPGSKNYNEFWEHLTKGHNLVSEIPTDRWDWKQQSNKVRWGAFMDQIDEFDAGLFSISPREAQLMDPQQRLFLQTVWSVIEDAGYKASDLAGTKTGLFVGVSTLDYAQLITANKIPIDAYTTTGRAHSILANRVSYFFDFRGPSEPVDTACSSSLISVIRAATSIKNGSCKQAIAGGVNVLASPELYDAFGKAGMLSPDGRCKTFDKSANGYVRGEGTGALYLKKLSDAQQDNDHIYAVIKGYAINHGGKANSLTAPNPLAQKDLLVEAYTKAGISAKDITYIEAHGTGTVLGDPVEIDGLKKAFTQMYTMEQVQNPPKNYCGIGAVKSNTGHLEAAAGIAGLVKTILALKHKTIPPSINLTEVNPYINLSESPFYIVDKLHDWNPENGTPRIAGVSSFGYGGANAHIVLQEYTNTSAYKETETKNIVPISARETKQVVEIIQNLLEYVKNLKHESDENRPNSKAGEITLFLKQTIQRIGNVSDITPERSIVELIQGQKDMMRFCNLIAAEYEIDFQPTQIFDCPNLRSLSNYIASFTGDVASINESTTHLEALRDRIAFTLQQGREEMEYRTAFVVTDLDDLVLQLEEFLANKETEKAISYVKNIDDVEQITEANGEAIQRAMEQNDLEGLKKLWMQGCKIEWGERYKGSVYPLKLNMPNYPFAKEKYWFTIPSGTHSKVNGTHAVHTMLDENISTLRTYSFTKKFTPEQFYIKDHVINGNTILPGVAYLEMARAAGSMLMEAPVQLMTNITWGNPIQVKAHPVNVTVQLEPKELNFIFTIADSENGTVYSKGNISRINTEKTSEQIDVAQLKNKYGTVFYKDELYTRFVNLGFSYGPSFKVVQEVYASEKEALAKLQLPAEAHTSLHEFVLPIPLMDGGLQTILSMNHKNVTVENKTYIPFALEKLEIYSEFEKEGYAWVQLTYDNNDVRKFNIILANSKGKVLAKLTNFTARAIKSSVPLEDTNKQIDDIYLYKPILIEEPLSNAISNTFDHTIWIEGVNMDDSILISRMSGHEKFSYVAQKNNPALTSEQFILNTNNEQEYKQFLQNDTFKNIQSLCIVQVLNNFTDQQEELNNMYSEYIEKVFSHLFYFAKNLTSMYPEFNVQFNFYHITKEAKHTPVTDMLKGFGKSVAALNRNFSAKLVNIRLAQFNTVEITQCIEAELKQLATNGDEVTYKQQKRYKSTVEKIWTQPRETNVLKSNGTYIITGGAGKVGLEWAKNMEASYRTNIILTGRTLPGAVQQKQIDSMNAAGSKVRFVQTDLTNYGQTLELVENTIQQFDRIDGVFHMAGTVPDVNLAALSFQEFQEVFKAKVIGANNLHTALQGHNLDFLVLFSSVSSTIGDFGACNYAMANAYLDSFAQWRNASGNASSFTVALGLPLIAEGNMQVPTQYKDMYQSSTGMIPLPVAEAFRIFNAVLSDKHEHAIVFKGNKTKIEKLLLPSEQVEAAIQNDTSKSKTEETSNATKEQCIAYLKQILAEAVKVDARTIKADKAFEKYGIDSMLVTELNEKLGQIFGNLPQTIFFEYFNLEELAGYFVREHQDKLIEIFGNHEVVTEEVANVNSVVQEHTNHAVLEEKAFEYFVTLLAEKSKMPISKIKPDVSFDKYGIDSMIIMELNESLEEQFGSIPQTLFFEYSTIKQLTGFFLENKNGELTRLLGDTKTQDITKEMMVETKPNIVSHSIEPKEKTEQASNGRYRMEEDIAVIGMYGRYPMAKNLDEFWNNIANGKDCIEEIPAARFNIANYYDPEPYKAGKSISKWGGFINNIKDFDADFFSVIPRVAKMMDPQERLFLETVYNTIEHAGYYPEQLQKISDPTYKTNVGIWLGFMYDDYKMLEAEEALKGNLEGITGYWNASLANRVSYQFNYTGPSIVLDTACSSSLIAIHMACESIRNKECYYALAGGVNLSYHPSKYVRLSLMGMASSEGKCRSFGEGGNGYVPGEGVGAVLLKPLSAAISDRDNILAVVKGSAVNHGGKTNGFSVPNPNAQAEVIDHAINNAKVNPRTISYIEAHGTGTALGDPIEISGLNKIFRKYTSDTKFCDVASVKSNVGHCEGAAGVAAFSKTVLQLQHKKIAPSLHSEILNKKIDLNNSPFIINQKLKDWERPVIVDENGLGKEYPRIAGISSFGAGGVNGHVVVQEYEQDKPVESEGEERKLILLSARNKNRLQELAIQWKEYIDKDADKLTLTQIAHVSQTGREFFNTRAAFIVNSLEDLVEKLGEYINGNQSQFIYSGEQSNDAAPIVLGGIINQQSVLTLAEQWVNGGSFDFESLYNQQRPQKVTLPVYPFERKEYWISITDDTLLKSKTIHHLEKVTIEEEQTQETEHVQQYTKSKLVGELKQMLGGIIEKSDDEISEFTEFSEYGIDSIAIQQFSQKLLTQYESLNETAVFAYQTIQEMADYILSVNGSEPEESTKRIIEAEKNDIDKIEETTKSFENTTSLKDAVHNYLLDVLSKIIEKPKNEIAINTVFSEYGIDSISITQFTKKLTDSFKNISETALFAYQTIDELAEYLLETENEELQKRFQIKIQIQPEEKKPVEQIAIPLKNTQAAAEGEEIAIIGISIKVPGANNMDELWKKLVNKESSISTIKKERLPMDEYFSDKKEPGKSYTKWGSLLDEVNKFDPLFFNISPAEAITIDPQERLFLQSAWEAIEDAGYTKESISKQGDVGVFVGVTTPSYNIQGLEQQFKGNDAFTGLSFASIANRVSYVLNLTGPSMSIDTMCSSSLVAVHEACSKLRFGECSTAIAGGVNLYLHPSRIVDLCRSKLLADDELSRSFTEGGIGFVPGEGVGTVLLKPLAQAIKDNDNIYGIVKGSAVKHSGRTNAYFTPSPLVYEKIIKRAVENAQIDSSSVSYVELQATGSELTDAIELEGIKNAYASNRNNKVKVGSLKPNFGHSEAASGITQLIKVLAQFKNNKLLPTILNGSLNPRFNFNNSLLHIQDDLETWGNENNGNTYPLRAGVSSYGAGGTGGHIILEEYKSETYTINRNKHLFIFSAKSLASLEKYLAKFVVYISEHPEVDLTRLAFTLQVGREQFNHRIGFTVSNADELQNTIKKIIETNAIQDVAKKVPGGIKTTSDWSDYQNHFTSENYNQILESWLKGEIIPWSDFYGTNKITKLPIPTYVFDERPCHLPVNGEISAIKQNVQRTIAENVTQGTNLVQNKQPDNGMSEAAISEYSEEELQLQQGQGMINSYLAVFLLKQMQSCGLLLVGGKYYLDEIIESLHMPQNSWYMLENCLNLLINTGLLIKDGEQYSVTANASSEELKVQLRNIDTRHQFIERVMPELHPYTQIFHKINRLAERNFSQKDIQQFFNTPEVKQAKKQILAGENRLSAVLMFQLNTYFANREYESGKTLTIIDLGLPTHVVIKQVIVSLADKFEKVDLYASRTKNDMGILNKNLYVHSNEVTQAELEFGTSIVLVPWGYKGNLQPYLNSDAVIVVYKPVEEAFLTLTLGWEDRQLGLIQNAENDRAFLMEYNLLQDKSSIALQVGNWLTIFDKKVAVQTNDRFKNIVTNEFAKALNLENKELDVNTNLSDYGLNSIIATRVFSILNTHCDGMLDANEFIKCKTIQDVSALVVKRDEKKQKPIITDNSLEIKNGDIQHDKNFFEASSGNIYGFTREGSGSSIVFLTALAFNHTIWDEQLRYFSKTNQVILISLPAHGPNKHNGAKLTFEGIADDLLELINQLGIHKAHVVGWCMAGNIAQVFAKNHPDKLASLVLLNTTPSDAGMRGINGEDLKQYSEDPLGTYDLEFQNIYQQDYMKNYATVQNMLNKIKRSHCSVELVALTYYIDNLFNFNFKEHLKKLNVRTLIVAGKNDITYPSDQVKLLYDGISKATFVQFNKAGHMPFINQSATFNEILHNFINKKSLKQIGKKTNDIEIIQKRKLTLV